MAGDGAFVLPEQKVPQSTEIPQNALTGFGMPFQLSEFVHDESKRLLLPREIGLLPGEQGLDFDLGFFDFTVQEMHKFLRALYRLER